jgi:predicted RNase H-like HicB family nuclease
MIQQYSMVIQWSDEDQTFIVSLPEFGPYAKTHGDTYQKAVRHGCDCLESLIEAFEAEGRPLPKPNKYHTNDTKKKRTKRSARHAATA